MGNSESRNARKVRRAIRVNDAATLQKLVKQKVDLESAINHYSRNTPLILAACYASQDVIPTLLKTSKDKDAYNAEGHTALDKGIMFYSLANEYHPHKTKELLKRRRVVQLLIDGGVNRVRSAELELWIRVNKSDPVFIHTITHLFCRSSSTNLKSIGFAVMLRINADLTCAACFLEAGATYKNYTLMYLTDLPAIDYKMPFNLAILILQSTCDPIVLQHIENIFLSAYPATKMKDEARQEILQLLLQNDHNIREKHQKQYPEYDGLIEYHKHLLKSLKWLCRRVIRRNAYPNVFFTVHQLNLPSKLENYLLLNEDGDDDPTLNASKNLNMGSNPPSAQIVRKRTQPVNALSSPQTDRLRARPFSHYHPADEIEKRRHRFSHSSVPSSPICPTASLQATSDFSPVKRRLRSQNSPYRQRPQSQAVARRDMPIIQLSPIITRSRTSIMETQTQGTQTTGNKSKSPKQIKKSLSPGEARVTQERPVTQKSPKLANRSEHSANKQNAAVAAKAVKRSPAFNARQVPPRQMPSKPVQSLPRSPKLQQDRKNVMPFKLSEPHTPEEPVPAEQVIMLGPRPTMHITRTHTRSISAGNANEIHNIMVPRPAASTRVVGSINQPVLSTFAPPRPMSPRRSPRDAKRPRPHSHFIPASEVRNIFPPPNMSPQSRPQSGDKKAPHINIQPIPDDRMTQSYPSPGKLADHNEYDPEFAYHLEEALMKGRIQGEDAEFASHLEEALMRRRSQPPGNFLPTKEVLIDFGAPSSSPYYTRSAGSSLNRQEVLLRPGSASLPRSDSSRRRSRHGSPPSSPFNLKVNPRFIVAGSDNAANTDTPPGARPKPKDSNSDYDEIEDSSNSSDDETSVNENEGYTRF